MANSDNSHLRSWLSFALIADVPLAVKLDWLREFGSVEQVLDQPLAALRSNYKLDRPLAEKFDAAAVDKVVEWIKQRGGHCFWLGDDAYPASLLDKLAYAPLVVFARGKTQLLERPCVALVGSPKPSAQAVERARTMALELAQEGVTVAAGVSPGIAQAAHIGAQAAGAGSIGVIGNAHAWSKVQLAEEICGGGLLISEHAPAANSSAGNYALRHRLLAGLASLCVVVEAARGCETVMLARDALNCGCEVAAVPSDPENSGARGGNSLLREGAALVETAKDVVALVRGLGLDMARL